MISDVRKQLIDYLLPLAGKEIAADVRIGLGYTVVKLGNGCTGLAWTPDSGSRCCTHLQSAGTLSGSSATDLLMMLADNKSALARSVGLAAANAMLAIPPFPRGSKDEILSLLDITPGDKVAMVGYFAPLVSKLKETGCRLDIIELNPERYETLPPEKSDSALAECTVAIITGTTIITGTCEEVLSRLGQPRAAVLLGPSSPMCAGIFKGSKITHVAGARVRDGETVLRVISEGGGTMLMKPYLEFETLATGN